MHIRRSFDEFDPKIAFGIRVTHDQGVHGNADRARRARCIESRRSAVRASVGDQHDIGHVFTAMQGECALDRFADVRRVSATGQLEGFGGRGQVAGETVSVNAILAQRQHRQEFRLDGLARQFHARSAFDRHVTEALQRRAQSGVRRIRVFAQHRRRVVDDHEHTGGLDFVIALHQHGAEQHDEQQEQRQCAQSREHDARRQADAFTRVSDPSDSAEQRQQHEDDDP
jgi:hypothetical protein